MVDFSTFSTYVNEDRFSTTVLGRPMLQKLEGLVSNRGVLTGKEKAVNPFSDFNVGEFTNTEALLYDVSSGTKDFLAFSLDYKSTASYGLAYFELNEDDWVKKA